MGQNEPKIAIFQFWINLPNRPILIICELEKMSITFFHTNPRIKTLCISDEIAEKSHFSMSSVIFWLFFTNAKVSFRRIFCGCRNFDHEIFRKKLMSLVEIHNKYLKLTFITYENIKKINCIFFFRPHSMTFA